MTTFTIKAAQTELLKLIERAEAGEEIIITRDEKQVVRLQPVKTPKNERRPGMMQGKLNLPDEFFFGRLPSEELAAWEEGCDEDAS